MQQFINEIIRFVNELWISITTSSQWSSSQRETLATLMGQNIFYENSLIGINITWGQLLHYLIVWVLAILFIVLFVKFVLKLVSIFRV